MKEAYTSNQVRWNTLEKKETKIWNAIFRPACFGVSESKILQCINWYEDHNTIHEKMHGQVVLPCKHFDKCLDLGVKNQKEGKLVE